MNTNKNVKNINNNIYKEITDFTQNENLINSIMEFIEYRKKNKKEVTELALKKIINRFKRWKYTEEECIESVNNSIINGWTGIFQIKERHKEQEQFKELDLDNLTKEEYLKLLKGDKNV